MAWHRTSGDNGGKLEVLTASGDIATFETNLVAPLQSVTVDIEATGGNGTPDNPNPINGYSSANITRCGVNIWNEEWELGTIDNNGSDVSTSLLFRSKGYIKVEPNKTYYCYCGDILGISGASLPLYFYDNDKNFISRTSVNNETFTTPNNVCFMRFRTGTDFPHPNAYQNDISINSPATDTTYHAYIGQTYTIAFGQTVYGGVLDVTRGKLTVTHKAYNFEDLDWIYNAGQTRFYTTISDDIILPTSYQTIANIKCEVYETVKFADVSGTANNNIIAGVYQTYNYITCRDTRYTDAPSFKTGLTGYKFICELDTPFDIDLTPEVISAIVGVNNVAADCGETEVEYLNKISGGDSGSYNKYDIDNSALISGKYIDENNGSERNQNDWSSTDFLTVNGNSLFFLGGIVSYVNNIYNAFYDENKQYVGRLTIAGGVSATPISIPSNAKYMRISCRTAYFTTNIYFMGTDS